MIKSVKHFRVYLFAVILVLGGVLLAGCGGNPSLSVVQPGQSPFASVSQTTLDEAAATSAADDAITHTYEAADTQIIRDDGEVIYDMAEYYKDDDQFGISHLVDDGEALYAVEAGLNMDHNEEEIKDLSIVKIDYNGGRQVLSTEKGIGYTDFLSFGDSLFFINDGFDSVTIGDVSKDGKAFNVIDWKTYAARFGAEPYFLSASFMPDNDYLYVQINTFEGNIEGVTRDVRIGQNMMLEEVPLKEDQYLVSGSKIILLSKDTGEKSVIHDASDYYDEDAAVYYLAETDNKLCFVESVLKPGFGEHLDAVVTLEKEGGTRNVLCSTVDNHSYQYLTIFSGQLIFVERSMAFTSIGAIGTEGGEVKYLEMPLDSQLHDVDWIDALADTLEVHMTDRSQDTPRRYTLVIDKDLHITLKES